MTLDEIIAILTRTARGLSGYMQIEQLAAIDALRALQLLQVQRQQCTLPAGVE